MLHYPQIVAALAAGKHVVCEKPLVGSLTEFDEIIADEKAAKGVLMPIFQYRYGDGIQQAKRDHRRRASPASPMSAPSRPSGGATPEYYAVPWRGKWKTELGGVLMTHAIHPHDMFAAT